jgi:hypothetical protein
VTIANVAINLAFFLTYGLAVSYYLIPISLLSLWTLLFAVVEQEAQSEALSPGILAGNRP